MKSIFVHWFTIVLILTFSFQAYAQTPDNLYQKGKNAFDREDCLLAVKYLFAYQSISKGTLDHSLSDKLNTAIAYCDERIALAIKTKQDLERYGHITEVTIDATGSADGWNTKKKTIKYQQPRGRYMPKPALPTSLPKKQTTKPTHSYIAKPLNIVVPQEKAAQDYSKHKTDRQSEQYAELKRRYKLLHEKQKKQADSYDTLKHKYRELYEKYRELKHQIKQ